MALLRRGEEKELSGSEIPIPGGRTVIKESGDH